MVEVENYLVLPLDLLGAFDATHHVASRARYERFLLNTISRTLMSDETKTEC